MREYLEHRCPRCNYQMLEFPTSEGTIWACLRCSFEEKEGEIKAKNKEIDDAITNDELSSEGC